jgi:agmatine deiminase
MAASRPPAAARRRRRRVPGPAPTAGRRRSSARLLAGTPAEHGFSFPPEWAPHAGTWLAWPRPEGISFPDTYHRALRAIVRIIREIARRETVHLTVPNTNYERIARGVLRAAGCPPSRLVFHHIATNECWCRDHGPAFVVRRRGRPPAAIVDWEYNAWGGKYPPWDADNRVPQEVARELGLPVFRPGLVMEGGAIDVNGAGTIMTTESCALDPKRNPGVSRADMERVLRAYYGQRHVVWLGEGIAGDDTGGHIDDIARFLDARTVAIAQEDDPRDENYRVLRDNRRRLELARDQDGRPFTIVDIPMPRPIVREGQRLPATYVNFLFVNGALLVPTFRDRPNDRRALATLQLALPGREVVGLDCVEVVWGLGTIHCLTQQQPVFA